MIKFLKPNFDLDNKVKVFTYRPTSDVFQRLVKNIKINNLENNIFPLELEIIEKAGKRELFFIQKEA